MCRGSNPELEATPFGGGRKFHALALPEANGETGMCGDLDQGAVLERRADTKRTPARIGLHHDRT